MIGRILVIVALSVGDPQLSGTGDWVTGRALDRQAQMGITGQWSDAPLRPMLTEMAAARRIPIFIDRRVDPTAQVDLSVSNLTWDQFLQAVGAEHEYGFVRLQNVYCFGPQLSCIELESVYQKLTAGLKERRQQLNRNWLSPSATGWQTLTEPRIKLQSLAAEHDITLVNPELLPHDLWPHFDSPKTSLVFQSLLLVHGFDKSIAISTRGTKLKIVDPANASPGQYTVYNLKNARSIADELRSEFAEVRLQPEGETRIQITGPIQTLTPAIRELIGRQEPVLARSENIRYTVELQGKRETILTTMASQLNVELKFDPRHTDILSEFVKLKFENATADEILTAALEGTGLRFRLTQSELSIVE